MGSDRLGYMDVFRGLCLCWIIWIHTNHPAFLDYPLHLPALFFISGCFFKPYPWPIFWRKKVNQLVIPFVFFYLLYFVFLIGLNFLKFHEVSPDIWASIGDVFRPYAYNDGYRVNYPLWFIMALLVLQFSAFGLVHLVNNRWLLLLIATTLSLLGSFCLRKIPLYFMVGRALSYFVYFMFGALFGKTLISRCEQKSRRETLLAATLYSCAYLITHIIPLGRFLLPFQYVEFLSAAYLLSILCHFLHHCKATTIFRFVGENALIVFGLHDMYLTVCRIFTLSFVGEMTLFLGFLNLVLVLLLMWPTVWLLKKYLPYCVGKKPILSLP